MSIKSSKMRQLYPSLNVGMAKSDVIDLLGQYTSHRATEEMEILGWYSKEFKGLMFGGFVEFSISVQVKNDVVVGFECQNIL